MALFRCAFDLRLLTAGAGVSGGGGRGGGAEPAGYGIIAWLLWQISKLKHTHTHTRKESFWCCTFWSISPHTSAFLVFTPPLFCLSVCLHQVNPTPWLAATTLFRVWASYPAPSPGCLSSSTSGRRRRERASPFVCLQSRSASPTRPPLKKTVSAELKVCLNKCLNKKPQRSIGSGNSKNIFSFRVHCADLTRTSFYEQLWRQIKVSVKAGRCPIYVQLQIILISTRTKCN